MPDLKKVLVKRNLLYLHDTVIMIQTTRACMRFYVHESISLIQSYAHKDLDSLLDDRRLVVLTTETTVMNDHNKVNYNTHFCF